ncbi:hypothetical protein [Plantibacter sp. LMC-P-059a]|uniref:hypothetical protein n=1 Tax=Plantibacter sp. LMC-P-059a TaxID=3040297 RepID=UPI00254E5301|nr:hypothetical protein [Plantibacter sp. LMC-P-059a]
MTTPDSRAFEHRNRARKRIWIIVTVAILFVLLAAFTLWNLPDMLLRNWFPDLPSAERAPFLGPAAQIVLFGLGGVIAIVGVGLSVARHAEELLAAELDRERATLERDRNALSMNSHRFDQEVERHRRDEAFADRKAATEQEFRSRFVSSVEMLTVNGAIKRTAGLYALAALADDWIRFDRRDEAQVCINVLCGYLRSPLTQKEDEAPTEEAAIRVSGYSIVRSRLVANGQDDPAWSGFTFDLRDAPIHFDVPLSGIVIGKDTVVDFSGADVLDKALTFSRARLTANGALRIDNAKIRGAGWVTMRNASMSDSATLDVMGTSVADQARIAINRLKMTENADIEISVEASDGARITLSTLQRHESTTSIGGTFTNETSLIVQRARIEDDADLDLDDVSLSDDAYMSLSHTAASGNGTISVGGAVLRKSGLEFDTEARPTQRGETLARQVYREDDRSSFGPSAFIRAGSAISTRPESDDTSE